MKPYPTEPFIIDEDELGPEITVNRPTDDAVKNWMTYLEPHELEAYSALPEVSKLHIALSVDPFMAFKYTAQK